MRQINQRDEAQTARHGRFEHRQVKVRSKREREDAAKGQKQEKLNHDDDATFAEVAERGRAEIQEIRAASAANMMIKNPFGGPAR